MQENYWVNTAVPARFFIFDARAVLPLPIFLVHWSLTTLSIVFVNMMIFWWLERRQYTVPVALRMGRLLLGARFRMPVRVRARDEMWGYRVKRRI